MLCAVSGFGGIKGQKCQEPLFSPDRLKAKQTPPNLVVERSEPQVDGAINVLWPFDFVACSRLSSNSF